MPRPFPSAGRASHTQALQILYHLIRPSSFPTPASWTIRDCSAFGLAHRLRIKMRIPTKSTKNAIPIPAAAPDERPNEGLEVAADVAVMLAVESEPAVVANPVPVMLEESGETVDVVADVEVFGLAYQAVSPQNPPKNAQFNCGLSPHRAGDRC